MPHRDSISTYLRQISIPEGVVIDFGCGGKPVTNYIELGEKAQYFSYDKNPQSKAQVILDMENENLPEGQPKADVGFCIEVLEHSKKPQYVLSTIWQNMKHQGVLYLTVPFLFPIHHEEDYWRWTDKGIKMLLEDSMFQVEEIIPTEGNQGWIVKALRK